MKKVLKSAAACLLLAVTVLSLAACGKCRHKETDWVVEKEATCTIVGRKVKKCLSCDEVLDTEDVVENCRYQEGRCIYCGEARYGNQYLGYREITLNGVEGYVVTGRGNCASADLEIPTHHNDKPVLAIGDGAFKDDKTLTSLVVGKNVREIGKEAFSGCVNLGAVTFGENSRAARLGDGAFKGCTALTAFAVPTGVQHLSAYLFDGCMALATLTLHDGMLSLGESALLGCDALQYKSENGMQFLGTEGNAHFLLVSVEKTAFAVTVPSDVKIIGASAFAGCKSLTAVSLPEGVISLSSFAFSGCTLLEDALLPETLTYLGDNAFFGCTSLEALRVPDAVLEIGAYAFKNCTKLSALTLPLSLQSIGEFAFLNTALTEIVLPASLERLGACAFVDCKNLTSVQFTAQTGWKIAENGATVGTPVDVSNGAENAARLMGEYMSFNWYRQAP